MAKVVKRRKRAKVFAVPGYETESGKHEVIFAPDGDLTEAAQRGNVKRFKKWSDAEEFAQEKGLELGAEVVVHSYLKNPTYIIKYKRLPRQKSPFPRRKMARITAKRPRLQR